MTRAATTARVAGACDFGDGFESARRDLMFDGSFGNEKTGADQRFVANPLVTRGIAILANRRQQRIPREAGAVRVLSFQTGKLITHVGSRGFGGGCADGLLSQQRRRSHQHTATRRLKLRLRHHVIVVDLNRNPNVRAADQRRRPTNKTRFVSIAHITRIEEMISDYFRQD